MVDLTRDDLARAVTPKVEWQGPSPSFKHAKSGFYGLVANEGGWFVTNYDTDEAIEEGPADSIEEAKRLAVEALVRIVLVSVAQTCPALLALATEALDRRDGLVFGPPDASGTRHAVAKDGEHYKLFCPTLRRWHWSMDIGTTRPDDETDGSAATDSEAIEKACAHDKARRGGK